MMSIRLIFKPQLAKFPAEKPPLTDYRYFLLYKWNKVNLFKQMK